MEVLNRRDVATRKVGLFQSAAAKLSSVGITPNQISVMSIVFASIGSIGLYGIGTSVDLLSLVLNGVVALAGIQGRLICNLLDGLVAIEGGKKTPVGDLYNEVPDRVSDTLLILAAGLGVGQAGFASAPLLAMAASLLALSTAYIRVLGGSLSLPQSFRGPMAKQHRMALLNAAVIFSVIEFIAFETLGFSMFLVLMVIAIGSGFTSYYRLRDIARTLKKRTK